MQTHVIVSYDGTDNDHDALALGKLFGDAGSRVSLAYVRHTVETDAASESSLLPPQVRHVRFEGERRMVLIPPPRDSGLTVEIGWERLR